MQWSPKLGTFRLSTFNYPSVATHTAPCPSFLHFMKSIPVWRFVRLNKERLQQTTFYDQSVATTWKVLHLTHTGSVDWFKFQQAHKKYPHFYALCPRRECNEDITGQSLQSARTFLQPIWPDYSIFLPVSGNTYHCGKTLNVTEIKQMVQYDNR